MNKQFNLATVVAAGLLTCVGSSVRAAEIYVAPTGNDSDPGTQARPFATIVRARDALRNSPRRMKESVNVILQGGVYYLPETFFLQ